MIDILAISPGSATAINRNLYVEMRRRGWNIELVVPSSYPVSNTRNLISEEHRQQDPPIHFLDLKRRNPRTFYFPQLPSLLQEKNPRIVILENDPVSYLAVNLGKYCSEAGARLFCLSCENLSFDVLPTFRRRGWSSIPSSIIKKYFYLAAKKHIDTVFTINNDGTKLFTDKGYKHVNKIPLGFDPEIFYEDSVKREKMRIQLKIQFPVIAYFGRMVEQKGVHLLLKALDSLKHLHWHLMLDKFDLYANPYNQRVDELIRLYGLDDRLLYVEANHYEVAAYMNAADVVVIPSLTTPAWKEQYGRVGPEAMACGKVVVAARAGALPELIEDGGILFNEGDVEELAQILKDYLEYPDRFEAVRHKAIARAHEYLTIGRQAETYERRIAQLS